MENLFLNVMNHHNVYQEFIEMLNNNEKNKGQFHSAL